MYLKSCFIMGMISGVAASAGPVQFESTERQTPLLELYTSEGCSSCPPAEAWLSQLKSAPGLWSDWVPVAFHVEYWDRLGWRDKWSSKQFSDRQRDYARALGSENIYTPEFILNGKEWRSWFGLKSPPRPSSAKVGVLRVSTQDRVHWHVSFLPAAREEKGYDANLALLDSELSSEVKAGENKGRHLNHDFVALLLTKQPLTGKADGFEGEFTLDTIPKAGNGRVALAVWVTRNGHLEATQAVGGWLPMPERIK